MAAGGGLVWAVRITGTSALKMEAMGFGDVTLVAMLGAFLGWQPSLMLFFLAPFPGVIVSLVHLAITRRHEIWFGPFLCMGAALTIVCWAWLWDTFYYIFELGMLVPALFVLMLPVMWAMLTIIRIFKDKFLLVDDEEDESKKPKKKNKKKKNKKKNKKK
jgi:hypothetical protein